MIFELLEAQMVLTTKVLTSFCQLFQYILISLSF